MELTVFYEVKMNVKTSSSIRYAIGVDLGGTKIALGVVDETGHIHQHQRLKTLVAEGAQAIENQIVDGIQHLIRQASVPISGVGVGVAGQIHAHTGEVIFAPNLKWLHIPLQANLKKTLQLPVCILNDVRAITWGEWQYGAGKGCHDLLCVFVGTGVGGGVVSGGKLLTGCSNALGEIGHMVIDFNGPSCACGRQGCLEVFASGWGIAARAQEAIEADQRGSASQGLLTLAHQQLKEVTAIVVAEAYRAGDTMAQGIIKQAKQALTIGLANLINAFNPCRLILGGGLIEGIPEIIENIQEGVSSLALKAATQSLEIVKGELGQEVGVIGSAAAVFNR